MEGISDIKIHGLDPTRPPRLIHKEPYINLYFELSHKAPPDWCQAFNQLVSKKKYSVKIDPHVGLFIDAWVREMEEIEGLLDELKAAVKVCTQEYIERIEKSARDNMADGDDIQHAGGEQGRLNKIIARLDFSD
jgi:hypothetical protein